MTAPDIRAQAIEELARHEVETYHGGWSCRCGVDGVVDYTDHLADALAEAGLLPTEVEEYTSRTWGQAEPVSRRRRYVTEWRTVAE